MTRRWLIIAILVFSLVGFRLEAGSRRTKTVGICVAKTAFFAGGMAVGIGLCVSGAIYVLAKFLLNEEPSIVSDFGIPTALLGDIKSTEVVARVKFIKVETKSGKDCNIPPFIGNNGSSLRLYFSDEVTKKELKEFFSDWKDFLNEESESYRPLDYFGPVIDDEVESTEQGCPQ